MDSKHSPTGESQDMPTPQNVDRGPSGEQEQDKSGRGDRKKNGHLAQEKEKNEELKKSQKNSFTVGQVLTFVKVRFPGNARSFPFLQGKRRFSYGQKVVAMSDRGMTVGYVNSFPYEMPFAENMLPLRYISRMANQEDLVQQQDNHAQEVEAEKIFLGHIERLNLDMTLTHVEFTQFGKKAVFYFIAPGRVDFRELVKSLVNDLKMRIELRQISVRDRTAALGSIGACGLTTCCSSFLKQYGHVSIKMAKNQNLALIPSKINGVCGQLKCCIKFENDVYDEKRKKLPPEGALIKALNGDEGRVEKLHLLVEEFDLLTTKGVLKRYYGTQYTSEEQILEKDFQFKERFNHIINETSERIGEKPGVASEVAEAASEITPILPKEQEPIVAAPEEKAVNVKNENPSKDGPPIEGRNSQHRDRPNQRKRNFSRGGGQGKRRPHWRGKKKRPSQGNGQRENQKDSQNRPDKT